MAAAIEKTWIDLTDMLAWRGYFTGIQRVTNEYARRFVKDGARFCAYDQVEDRFFEVTLQFLNDLQAEKPEVMHELMTFRRKLRLLIGKPYYALPEKYKQSLRPLVRSSNHAFRYVMSKTINRNKPFSSPYKSFPDAKFESGDVVVLTGAGWNEGGVLEALIRIKRTAVPIRIIQHINDILPIYQPQLFDDSLPRLFTPYIDAVIREVDVITVISEATKRDLVTYCKEQNVQTPTIRVVRLGDDPHTAAPLCPTGLEDGKRFILAVGTFEVRKNYILLYQAVKLAQIEGRELPKIIIAGRKGWLSADIRHQIKRDPFANENIIWLDGVSDGELGWLFQNCMFTVFPSLAEGWGLPVAESLKHGKLSIVSGVSSMLEIGAGLVDYFLPYDARECMEKMQYYLAENRYKAANLKVQAEYKIFTWDKSYEAFLRVVIQTSER